MTIRVALEHRTTYRFDRAVTVHPHVVRLRPAPHCRTPIEAYSLTVRPGGHFVNWQQDAFGNHQARLVFPERVRELEIVVDLVADMTVINPFDFFLEEYAEHFPFSYPAGVKADLEPYLRPVDEVAPGRAQAGDAAARGGGPGPMLREWMAEWAPALRAASPGDLRMVDLLVEVNQRVNRAVGYTVRMEPGVQSPDETLEKASGSCRDSAWLLASALRELGLASRFVSGYLVQLESDVKPLDGPAGPEHDFTDLHAWTEVYVPGAGWIGLDPTSGLFAGEGHIPLAATPHPATAAPITGSTGPCEVDFDFSNTVRRVHEDPRVTRPYTDEQWSRVQAAGWAVDGRLADGDVRLTMGGEPTFVAVDDMEAAEWNTAADGPQKRRLAAALASRLFDRWAPGGVLHHGQGKWYPGEPLPRWAIGLVWRVDGQPLWRDPALLDVPSGPAVVPPGSPAAERAVRAVAVGAAARLGIGEALCLPAYEDLLHDLWREARQPWGDPPAADVDPDDPELIEPQTRQRLIDSFDDDPGRPAGWVVPVFRSWDGERWASAPWRLRRKHLFLTPGTSPLGLRLPLDSVAWQAPPPAYERSPFEERGPLPQAEPWGWAAPRGTSVGPGTTPAPDGPAEAAVDLPAPPLPSTILGHGGWTSAMGVAPGSRDSVAGGTSAASRSAAAPDRELPGAPQSPDSTTAARAVVPPALIADQATSPRTALAVEERDGHVFVFLPPLTHAEHAVELLAAIEGAAAEAGVPVVLEGYPLPGDPRLRSMSVTPDPGVIEVNIAPQASWPELEATITALYADAEATRLGTDKFDLDGHHTGTGGGNHVTLGGPTAADSPLLRRPDVLRSLITYWQHHPALSYVFSGRFIGPTSQSPRVDEGRHETLYELETAFGELERLSHQQGPDGEPLPTPPWLVDRLLRHLLTDITGNTHRAEFCIDKLYSPDSDRGRLGLLEMRGFEMPPHPRMALVQALLVRALLVRFWEDPYSGPLVRWGTRLHDRFLLPAFAAADLRDVVTDLQEHGIAFEHSWLEPFLEFRFPRLGETTLGGVHLELRSAVEPWHVLGEEVGLGGTARYVDSSVERVQIAATGLVEGRHAVTCNGVPIPLVPVAGAGWGTGATGAGGGAGGRVAGGVRYRAWAPPSALHPTIGVHSPLVFDLVDRWNNRSLGGFTYHVVHPGGRSYDRYPVNAAEAESRRGSRFEAAGHTPGPVDTSAWPAPQALMGPGGGEYPVTLDLRRAGSLGLWG